MRALVFLLAALALVPAAAVAQETVLLVVRQDAGGGRYRSDEDEDEDEDDDGDEDEGRRDEDGLYPTVSDALDDIPKRVDAPYVIEIQDSGTYDEFVVINKKTAADRPITIRAQVGQSPTIQSSKNKKPAIHVKSPFVTLENLVLVGRNQAEGVHINSADDVTVRDCTIRGAENRSTPGIYVQESRRVLLQGNVVTGNDVGILFYGENASDGRVLNNILLDNTERGLWIYGGAGGNVVRNNTFVRNSIEIQLGFEDRSKDEPGAGNVLRNNVVVAVGDGGLCIASERDGDPGALPNGTTSDYNDLFPFNGARVGRLDERTYDDLGAWVDATDGDRNSLSVNPLFVNFPGDLHLQSTTGSFHGGAWTADGAHSPAIDAGEPTDDPSAEPAPNGDRVNLGAYGGTAQASLTAEAVAALPEGVISASRPRGDGSGTVDIVIEARHADGSDLRARLDWATARDESFSTATLAEPVAAESEDSGGPPAIDNGTAYQLGAADDRRIVTDGGSNAVRFGWDTGADLPGVDGTRVLRLTLNDGQADQASPATFSVEIDNLPPSGVDALEGIDATAESITWQWSAATDDRFSGYRLVYGTDQAAVEDGSAAEWGPDQDGNLTDAGTTSTTITGLTRGAGYFARVHARDTWGNEASSPTASYFTAGRDTIYHYVAAGGAERGVENNPDAPWNSVERAVEDIPSNVERSESTYVVEVLDSATYEGRVEIDKRTSERYSIRLRPRAGQRPRLAASGDRTAVEIGSPHARLEGFVLEGRNDHVVDIDDADGVIVRDCEIRGNGTEESAIRVRKSARCRLEDNLIFGAETGISLERDVEDSRLLRNRILDNDGGEHGIRLGHDARRDSLVNNTIVGFKRGLTIDDKADGDHVVRNNIVHNAETAFYIDRRLDDLCSLCDYNNLHPEEGGDVGSVDGDDFENLAEWVDETGIDVHSLSLDPLFASTSGNPVGWDLHLSSPAGRWNGGEWITSDASPSPAIDAGHPRDDLGGETEPHGNRINLGAYGGTREASRSGPLDLILAGVPYDEYLHIGIPLEPVDGDPGALFGDDFPGIDGENPWGQWLRVVRWDIPGGDYVYYNEDEGLEGNPPDFAAGRGAWFIQWWSEEEGNGTGDTLTVSGTPVSVNGDFAIAVEPPSGDRRGVNQMANPFLFDIDWADARVRDRESGRTLSVEEAAERGWVDGHAYVWDFEDDDYEPLSPGNNGRISMWQGFWFEQLDGDRRLELLLPPEAAAASVNKRAQAQPTALAWTIDFDVVAANPPLRSQGNRAGVHPDAARHSDHLDALQFDGLTSPYLSVYFPHDDPLEPLTFWPRRPARFKRDIRDADWDEQEWTFVVATDLPNTSLRWIWTDPASLPAGYQAAVVDDSTEAVVIDDLRAEPAFSFDSGPDGRRTFRLVVTYEDILGDVTGDRRIDDDDADEVLAHAVGTRPLPEFVVPFAEVSGNALPDSAAAISAYDAAWILRVARGSGDSFPAQGGSDPVVGAQARPVYLGVPSPAAGGWEVPVIVDDAEGVIAAQGRVDYDPGALQVLSVLPGDGTDDIRAAHALSEGAVDFAAAAASATGGQRVVARLLVQPEAGGIGFVDDMSLSSVELNEGRVSAAPAATRPHVTTLFPPAPNPFNASVTLRLGLPAAGQVRLSVYNVLGQRVRTLVDGHREAGLYPVVWDTRDAAGRQVGSGAYFVRLEAGAVDVTQSVMLLR